VKSAPLTLIELRARVSLALYSLAAELGTFARISPRTTVPLWAVPLCHVKVTVEWVASTLTGVPMTKVLPVPLESPVPPPVGTSRVGLYVKVKTTSVTPEVAGTLDKVTGMPLAESLGTLMGVAPSGPRAKSGMLKASLLLFAVVNEVV
jgi:hypothetical protein